MSNTWLLLDVHFLAHRAFHTTGNLAFEGVGTGVVFGLLRDVTNLQETFATRRIAFCFDSPTGNLKRQELDPNYKANRRPPATEEEAQLLGELRRQIRLLREMHLGSIGYKNVFAASGYEADDVIASICRNLPDGDSAIIVSSDKDLWQLLSDRVSMWNPMTKKMMTSQTLWDDFRVCPEDWAEVKAIAGCGGDNVAGVKGVGEKTAAKYISGGLKEKTKAFQAIESAAGEATWERNLPLICLPFPGCPTFELQEDNVSGKAWDKLTGRFGMKTLKGEI